jgi:hypothetical protein
LAKFGELAGGTGGSVDAATGAAIGPYRQARIITANLQPKGALMKAIRPRIRLASFVSAIVLLLQISPALAADTVHGRVELIFLKWVIGSGPLMAGVVSGDVGGGTFAGEILSASQTGNILTIDALYRINGGAQQFTAHNHIAQDNATGTAVISGVVTDGPLEGARVQGEYQVIHPCGITNAEGSGDFCFQGTLTIRH